MGRQRDKTRREYIAARRKRVRGAGERAKSAFLSVVSHELRTPLNTILGQAELLADQGLPPQAREAAAAIRSAGEDLYGLLNDILELARLEGGAAPALAAPFDIRTLLDGIRRLFQPQAWARQLDLDIAVDRAVPARLRGDAGRIRQTLINLTGNALKFTERGGVSITAEMDGPALKVSVSDTGKGIDRQDCRRLFRPFEQNDDVLTRRHGGLGLGLALCSRLVATMGGKIGVTSEPGKGSTFWFTAAVAAAAPARDEAAADGDTIPDRKALDRVRGLCVLAADDNPLHKAALARILGDAEIACDIVDDGMQAVELAGRKPFDAIILDAHMPGVDGIQAARMIRALWGQRRGAVLLIACAENDVAEAEAATVCDRVVRKPYCARQVVATLAAAVGEGEAASFDATGVLELEQTVGRAALVGVLSSFLASATEMIEQIEAALPQNDCATLERIARDLAGAAAGLGLVALTGAARELSQAARKGDTALQGPAKTLAVLAGQAHRALVTLFPDAGAKSAA